MVKINQLIGQFTNIFLNLGGLGQLRINLDVEGTDLTSLFLGYAYSWVLNDINTNRCFNTFQQYYQLLKVNQALFVILASSIL